MKRLTGALAFILTLLALPAVAQTTVAKTVVACGTPGNTPVVGNSYSITMDTTGALCSNTVGTATITGSVTANAGTNLNTSALELDATATATQANAGSDASKAVAVQGITGGKSIPVTVAPSSAAGDAITPSISASSLATSLVAKASAGNYYDGYCQSTTLGRCILYNATAAPSPGALTAALVLECAVVPAGGSGGWQYASSPRRATVGMTELFSSSPDCNTYTASSTAYIHASVQ